MATENNQDANGTEEAKVKKAKSHKDSEKTETTDSSDFDKFESTADIPVSDKVIDQIIGQERAVNIIKKASSQKRNVLLIGSPGTGKSMLAQAMAELLPVEALEDILVYQNSEDENAPVIKVVKAGEGRKMLQANRMKARMSGSNVNLIIMAVVILVSFLLLFYARPHLGDIITAALLIGLFVMSAMLTFATQIGKGKLMPGMEHEQMKLLVDNHDKKKAPFVDATGARAGALLGDCRHDPLQSILGKEKLYFCSKSSKKPQKGKKSNKLTPISFEKLWNRLVKKYPKLVEHHPNSYEAIVLPKKEKIYTQGYKNGKPILSRIYSLNRYLAEKETVELTTPTTTVTLTSDHKLITPQGSKHAKNTRRGQQVITLS